MHTTKKLLVWFLFLLIKINPKRNFCCNVMKPWLYYSVLMFLLVVLATFLLSLAPLHVVCLYIIVCFACIPLIIFIYFLYVVSMDIGFCMMFFRFYIPRSIMLHSILNFFSKPRIQKHYIWTRPPVNNNPTT